MVEQFSARGVQVVQSDIFSSNYTLEYIRKYKASKSLSFHPHSLEEYGWCSGESDRFGFGLSPYVRDGDLKS